MNEIKWVGYTYPVPIAWHDDKGVKTKIRTPHVHSTYRAGYSGYTPVWVFHSNKGKLWWGVFRYPSPRFGPWRDLEVAKERMENLAAFRELPKRKEDGEN